MPRLISPEEPDEYATYREKRDKRLAGPALLTRKCLMTMICVDAQSYGAVRAKSTQPQNVLHIKQSTVLARYPAGSTQCTRSEGKPTLSLVRDLHSLARTGE